MELVGVRCITDVNNVALNCFGNVAVPGLPVIIVTTWALVRYLVQLDKGRDPMVSSVTTNSYMCFTKKYLIVAR